VFKLYYHCGKNFREIGKMMDLTESRICQLHRKMKNTLISAAKKRN